MVVDRLFIVTSDYPYSCSSGDSNFVLPELKYLKDSFQVCVISTSDHTKIQSEILDDVEYRHFRLQLTWWKKIKYFFSFFTRRICRKELVEIVKNNSKNAIGKIYKSIEFYACAEEFYAFLKQELNAELSEEAGIFLNYWCNAYSLSLILHNGKYRNLKRATRLHGCDLYEDRYAYGRQPFKKIINAGMDKLFFVSYNAREYYLRIHPELERGKTYVSSLGVEKRIAVETDRKEEKGFLLVSCSSIIPLKRVELIIEALSLLEPSDSVDWVHFGDGSQQEAVTHLAEEKLGMKKKVSFTFKGRIKNEEVKKFYCEKRPDCFITTSSTEGSPVSVMEALACGIPVIGTAVGDIPYMIRDNGILLTENPDPKEVASAIEKMISCSGRERKEMRRESVRIWEERYSSEKNERDFIKELRILGSEG